MLQSGTTKRTYIIAWFSGTRDGATCKVVLQVYERFPTPHHLFLRFSARRCVISRRNCYKHPFAPFILVRREYSSEGLIFHDAVPQLCSATDELTLLSIWTKIMSDG